MLEKGGFSFVALLVINPVIILLYQNCSLLPAAQSQLAAKELMPQKRVISSVGTPEKVDLTKIRASNPSLSECKGNVEVCPVATVE